VLARHLPRNVNGTPSTAWDARSPDEPRRQRRLVVGGVVARSAVARGSPGSAVVCARRNEQSLCAQHGHRTTPQTACPSTVQPPRPAKVV